MAINTEKLGMVLQNFVTATSDVQGAALVTPDGRLSCIAFSSQVPHHLSLLS